MARTGIAIQVSNTVLGSPPRVDSNSLLVVVGATAVATGQMAFSLDTPYLLRAADDLDTLGITESNNPHVYRQVNDYYARNAGSILWLVGTTNDGSALAGLPDYVRATVVNGFQFRPRQIGVSNEEDGEQAITPDAMQSVIDTLYPEGFSTVAVIGGQRIYGAISGGVEMPDLSGYKAGMVGTVIVTNRQNDRPCVGLTLGYMASLSVGTSIGDASLPSLGDSFFYIDYDSSASKYINTPCAKVPLDVVNFLGDMQYIFVRTRPPRNGLWFNDGATAEEAITALSTLEAARTIASMVDELRLFFTPYLNNKIPVNRSGDIQSTYKQVVLDNARSAVIVPYILSGDISDASIDLKAQNNDMVGTRTWEVTLSIQGAPTLRWIDGFAFYVKSLN